MATIIATMVTLGTNVSELFRGTIIRKTLRISDVGMMNVSLEIRFCLKLDSFETPVY